MSTFFLEKNVAKIGDSIEILDSCGGTGSMVYSSSDTTIANIDTTTGTLVRASNIGVVTISEPSGYCSNTGVLLTITQDGNPPIMTLEEYQDIMNLELIIICFTLVIYFFYVNWKN